MEICKTTLAEVWLIKPDVNADFRGDYVMTYSKDLYHRQMELPHINFLEHDISTTLQRGVLRGIHYSPNCWKLNECLHGKIYYVCVNCDKESIGYGQWEAFILSGENHHQIFKHPRYGTGFVTLTDDVVFHYIQSQYFDAKDPDQQTIKWDSMNIWWPTKTPILSVRDEGGHYETKG